MNFSLRQSDSNCIMVTINATTSRSVATVIISFSQLLMLRGKIIAAGEFLELLFRETVNVYLN